MGDAVVESLCWIGMCLGEALGGTPWGVASGIPEMSVRELTDSSQICAADNHSADDGTLGRMNLMSACGVVTVWGAAVRCAVCSVRESCRGVWYMATDVFNCLPVCQVSRFPTYLRRAGVCVRFTADDAATGSIESLTFMSVGSGYRGQLLNQMGAARLPFLPTGELTH